MKCFNEFLLHCSCHWTILTTISFISLVFLVSNGRTAVIKTLEDNNEIQPEFVEPIKNITSPIGTNVDFACVVRHLGGSRIMWFKRQVDKKEELLGVNGLKISKSPKISLSVIPSSGIVTQSILYIYNIDYEDIGEYICGVNTNPPITQSGSLEIKPMNPSESFDKEKRVKTTTPEPAETPRDQQDFTVTTIILDNNGSSESNGIFCIDFPKLWKDSKVEAQKFFYGLWDKLHRYI